MLTNCLLLFNYFKHRFALQERSHQEDSREFIAEEAMTPNKLIVTLRVPRGTK